MLFVSEKMAALSVVYDRLKRIGLEQHCLEVHSNKDDLVDMGVADVLEVRHLCNAERAP